MKAVLLFSVPVVLLGLGSAFLPIREGFKEFLEAVFIGGGVIAYVLAQGMTDERNYRERDGSDFM